ncbi:MAG TPA: hypothetical protein VGF08_08890 [Terriglobales bacterium]|jgi:hypothetical protein
MRPSRTLYLMACTTFLFLLPLNAQQTDTPGAQGGSDSSAQPPQDQRSLADIARGLRKNQQAEVRMTPADAKALFALVDKITDFVTHDTDLPRKAPVKRRLVGQADVEKFFREKTAKTEYAQRFARAELTMKKFGLLPRDFDLRGFLVQANGQQVAGFYDDDSKVISMLNWIPLDQQEPILAHELTHALQDQNYDLKNWAKAGLHRPDPRRPKQFVLDDEESQSARHAVAEGQGMVVYFDYMLAPMGRTLKDTPGIIASMEDPSVSAVIDTPIMHNAPIVLRESGAFPYRDGLLFEAALLQRGGKKMAFSGALTNPPRNSHEVLQPEAYLASEKPSRVRMPDVRPLVAEKYELYDSGGFGELDVRILLKQLGEKRVAADLAMAWDGGAYVAFRPANPMPELLGPGNAADVALLYVSHWKTPEAAQKFAKAYTAGVARRYKNAELQRIPACTGNCPTMTSEWTTEEGPVIVEQWADNTVLVSESFDDKTAARLRNAVLDSSSAQTAGNFSTDELSLRLYWLPAFREFQDRLRSQVLAAMSASLQKAGTVKSGE